MAGSLGRLLASLQDNAGSSSESSDDDEAGQLASLLADPITRLLGGLAILEGIKGAMVGDGIKVGDLVRMGSDEGSVRGLQTGHGGWNDDMKRDLGEIGAVVRGMPGEDVTVHFGNKTWRMNPEACVKLKKEEIKGMFNFGDQIYVEFTDKIAKEMQKYHGGWDPLMEGDLQKIGRVIGVDDDGDVAVQFWTRTWRMNSAACKILTTETGCSFKKGDKVFMDSDVDIGALKALQEAHGAWSPKIARALGKIGEVVDIDSDGDLVVKIGDGKWALNPDVCTKIISMKDPGGDFFCIGDMVSIGLDMALVKDMQKGHGEWHDDIVKFADKKGKVVFILPNGDLTVDFGTKKWRLNPVVCTRHGDPYKRDNHVRPGRHVAIVMDRAEFLKLQIGHGGVNTSMLTDIGKVGRILEVHEDRDLTVQFSPNMWCLTPAICTKLSELPKPNLAEGDRIFVGLPAEIVKDLQKDHGGFVDTMYRLLGQVGRVCKLLPTGDIVVLYGILPMVLSPAIATSLIPVPIGAKTTVPVNMSPFSSGDLVRIEMDIENVKKLQDGHGGWKPEMANYMGKVGIVDRLEADGDVRVCYGKDFVRWNPAVCTLIRSDEVQDNTRSSSDVPDQAQAASSSQSGSTRGSDMKCGKCKSGEISVVFGCGHGACEKCNKQLETCPECEANITYRTKLYF